MTNEAIAVQLADHQRRLQTVEDFMHEVRGTLNRILVGVIVGIVIAVVGLAVRH